MIKTNDLKKGIKIKLNNGWEAKIEDNMRGNTRLATVYGDFTEMGSVYSHDIVKAFINNEWADIEYTPAQVKLKKSIDAMGW